MYRQGLDLYPKHIGILRNYANLLRERGDSLLRLLVQFMKCIKTRFGLKKRMVLLEKIYCECIDLLREQGACNGRSYCCDRLLLSLV